MFSRDEYWGEMKMRREETAPGCGRESSGGFWEEFPQFCQERFGWILEGISPVVSGEVQVDFGRNFLLEKAQGSAGIPIPCVRTSE